MLRNVSRKDSLKLNFSTILLSTGANILKSELIRINYKQNFLYTAFTIFIPQSMNIYLDVNFMVYMYFGTQIKIFADLPKNTQLANELYQSIVKKIKRKKVIYVLLSIFRALISVAE